MKKVSEVANLLGVSRQAVHKRIKHPKFKSLIIKKGSIIYIKDEAISMLLESINIQTVNPIDEVDNLDVKQVDEIYEKLINSKDETINQLIKQVDALTRLLEQQQVLMLNSQNEIKLLNTKNHESSIVPEYKKKAPWISHLFGTK